MHAKNRSVAVHATLIVEMPRIMRLWSARYRENTRNDARTEREKERILSNHVFLDDNCIVRTQLYNKRRIEESDKEKLKFFEFLLVQLYIRTPERRTWFKPLYQGILLRNDS